MQKMPNTNSKNNYKLDRVNLFGFVTIFELHVDYTFRLSK